MIIDCCTRLHITIFQVFVSKACEMHLLDLLRAVDQEVEEKGGQTVEVIIRGFKKDLYFNPGFSKCTTPGCHEFGMTTIMDNHVQEGCTARMVPCIDEKCRDKIPLQKLNEHLSDRHEYMGLVGVMNMCERVLHFEFHECPDVGDVGEDWHSTIIERFLPFSIDAYGSRVDHKRGRQGFFPRFFAEGGVFYMYMRIVADEAVARNYCVDMEVATCDEKTTTKVSNVKVYSVDIPWKDVKEDGRGVLAIHPTMALHYESEDTTDVTQCESELLAYYDSENSDAHITSDDSDEIVYKGGKYFSTRFTLKFTRARNDINIDC